jgi:restriction endonuclease S subunit
VWILKINNINAYYVYNILKNNIDYKQITSGSVIPKLTKEKISNIKIKIPKNKKLIKDLDPLFQEIEKLQTEMKEADLQYKKLIKELSEEAIPTNKQIENKTDNDTSELSEEMKESIIIETSEKKPKTTKKKKS